jgi:hypothetical protein
MRGDYSINDGQSTLINSPYSFTAPLKIPRAIVLLAARKSKTEGIIITVAISAVSRP